MWYRERHEQGLVERESRVFAACLRRHDSTSAFAWWPWSLFWVGGRTVFDQRSLTLLGSTSQRVPIKHACVHSLVKRSTADLVDASENVCRLPAWCLVFCYRKARSSWFRALFAAMSGYGYPPRLDLLVAAL